MLSKMAVVDEKVCEDFSYQYSSLDVHCIMQDDGPDWSNIFKIAEYSSLKMVHFGNLK